MRIDVNSSDKLVTIWLTKSEVKDVSLRESLKPLYKKYKEKKYLVAVFESGEGDLKEYTEALIKYNKYELYKDDKSNSA